MRYWYKVLLININLLKYILLIMHWYKVKRINKIFLSNIPIRLDSTSDVSCMIIGYSIYC